VYIDVKWDCMTEDGKRGAGMLVGGRILVGFRAISVKKIGTWVLFSFKKCQIS